MRSFGALLGPIELCRAANWSMNGGCPRKEARVPSRSRRQLPSRTCWQRCINCESCVAPRFLASAGLASATSGSACTLAADGPLPLQSGPGKQQFEMLDWSWLFRKGLLGLAAIVSSIRTFDEAHLVPLMIQPCLLFISWDEPCPSKPRPAVVYSCA